MFTPRINDFQKALTSMRHLLKTQSPSLLQFCLYTCSLPRKAIFTNTFVSPPLYTSEHMHSHPLLQGPIIWLISLHTHVHLSPDPLIWSADYVKVAQRLRNAIHATMSHNTCLTHAFSTPSPLTYYLPLQLVKP